MTKIGKFWRLLGPWRGEVPLSVTPSSPRSMACPVLPKMRLAVIWLPMQRSLAEQPTTTPGPPLLVMRLPAAAVTPPIVLPDAPSSISTPPPVLPRAWVPVMSVPIRFPSTRLSVAPSENAIPRRRQDPHWPR